MKHLGMHRVDGRSYWFAGYFNAFDPELMTRYAGEARTARFRETFGGAIPFPDARITRVYDPDPTAAQQFAATFAVPVAATMEEFADGLDAVIIPFPAGGPARDYGTIMPLLDRGLALFLDRVILEQHNALRNLCDRAHARHVPLHITAFPRYCAELLVVDGERPWTVTAVTSGDPAGYGADVLDAIDELMGGPPLSVINTGDADCDILRIRYPDGRHALLQLVHHVKVPMLLTATGTGWHRTVLLDGSQNHRAAYLQFQAFLRALDTREPPVSYDRVLANAALLQAAQRKQFSTEIMVR